MRPEPRELLAQLTPRGLLTLQEREHLEIWRRSINARVADLADPLVPDDEFTEARPAGARLGVVE